MMPRIKPLLVLCAALLTVTPAASADVNSDMNQFFNKLASPPIPHSRTSGRAGRRLWLTVAPVMPYSGQNVS